MSVIENVYTKIRSILDTMSVRIDLPPDLPVSLLFQDYPPYEERLKERNYYAEDIQTKQIFYYFYQDFPNIVDEILTSKGLKIRVQLQSAEAYDEMLEMSRKFYLLADTLILQSSFSQPEAVTMEVGWADQFHRNEVVGRILKRSLLNDWLQETGDMPLLGGIIYLPYISGSYEAGPGLGRYTKEDAHIDRIQTANMKLDLIPSVLSGDYFQQPIPLETTCTVEIPYIDGISLFSLSKLREDEHEYFVAYRETLIEAFNQLWMNRWDSNRFVDEFDEVKYKLIDVAAAMRQELSELERSGLISALRGEVKLFRVEIMAVPRENEVLHFLLKL